MQYIKPHPLWRSIVLVLLAFLPACSPLALVNITVPEDTYRHVKNIAYGAKPQQKLDIYKPSKQRHDTVVMFLYGGSWKRGHRSNYRFVGEAFASRGFVTVIPNYRVYPEVQFPRFIEDAAAAVGWVRRHIGKHGGNLKKVVLIGHSAGAHIAALLALDPRYLKAAGVSQNFIAGIVGLAGPYVIDPSQYWSIRPIFETAKNPRNISSINFVHSNTPPMLLLHGAEDNFVDAENSRVLAQRLQKVGSSATYISFANTGHVGVLLALASPFQGSVPVLEKTVAFLERLSPQRSVGDGPKAFQ